MRKFFNSAKDTGYLLVWEPRGGWSELTIKALCSELGLVHCVDPMEKESLYGKPQYFRLYGGPHYRHCYSQEELEYLKDKVGNRESYVLFNNLNMLNDALAFARLMQRAGNQSH